MPTKSKTPPPQGKKRDADFPSRSLTKLFKGGSESSLLWLLASNTRHPGAEGHISKWQQQITAAQLRTGLPLVTARQWIEEISNALPTDSRAYSGTEEALTILGAAHAIRDLLVATSESECSSLVERLLSQTDQLRLREADELIHPWLEQLLAVELPLTLTYQLPTIVVQADLAQPAADWMAGVVGVGLDDDGWPKAELLPLFGPLMASWARSLKLIVALKLDF